MGSPLKVAASTFSSSPLAFDAIPFLAASILPATDAAVHTSSQSISSANSLFTASTSASPMIMGSESVNSLLFVSETLLKTPPTSEVSPPAVSSASTQLPPPTLIPKACSPSAECAHPNIRAVIGGLIGAIAVLFIMAFAVLYARRWVHRTPGPPEPPAEIGYSHSANAAPLLVLPRHSAIGMSSSRTLVHLPGPAGEQVVDAVAPPRRLDVFGHTADGRSVTTLPAYEETAAASPHYEAFFMA